jgi:Flp pilus assembly pilin Flp
MTKPNVVQRGLDCPILGRLPLSWHLLRRSQGGQDLIEYALIAGFVAVMMGAMLPSQFVPMFCAIYDRAQAILNCAASQGG